METAAAVRRGVLLVLAVRKCRGIASPASERSLGSCLAPHGRAFLIDNRDHPTREPNVKDPYVVEYGPDLNRRRLEDGREYRVVKVMYEPDELQTLITAAGL